RSIERYPEDASGPFQDRDELIRLVEIEAGDETEPLPQRTGDHSTARGRPDEREPWQVETDRARRRSFADDDVELEVLHRGIEHLFDGAREPMDLVDEQHVAVVEIRQDRGEVAGTLERGAAGDSHPRIELVGDDAGERGLAEARRTGEQEVVERLATPLRRPQHDLEMLTEAGLADELGQPARPQRGLPRNPDRVGVGAQ